MADLTRKEIRKILNYHSQSTHQSHFDVVKICHMALKAEKLTRDNVAHWMTSKGMATGHGDTLHDLLEEIEAVSVRKLTKQRDALLGAAKFVMAFYDPNQRYLDTNAWKQAEAGLRAAIASVEVK